MPFAYVSLRVLRIVPGHCRGLLMLLVLSRKRGQCRHVSRARFGAIDNLYVWPPIGADQDSPAFNPPGARTSYPVEETAHFIAEESVFDSFASTVSQHKPDNDPTAAGSCP